MTSATYIRRAEPQDHRAVNGVMRRSSLAVESGEMRRLLLAEPAYMEVDALLLSKGQVFVAESESLIRGFASFAFPDGTYGELEGLFVDPSHWRLGIGQMLVEAVQHEMVLRRVKLIRVVAGVAAVPFYQSVGFSVIGEEKTALGPTVPIMTKALPS